MNDSIGITIDWSTSTSTTTNVPYYPPFPLNTTTNNLTNSTTNSVVNSQLLWYEVLYSVICVIGAITVSTNIAVFSNRQLKDPTYTFLLAEACVDLCYVSLLACYLVFRCGLASCEQRKSQLAYQIYVLVVANYLTSCMAINNILIELFLSIQRVCTISNWSFLQNISARKTVLVILTISLVYYVPSLFLNKISSQVNSQGVLVYSLPLTDFGLSELGHITPAILISIRLLLATFGLFSLNICMFYQFQKHLKKKSALKAKATSMTTIQTMVQRGFMANKLNNPSKLPEVTETNNSSSRKVISASEPESPVKSKQSKQSKQSSDLRAKRNLTIMIISTSLLFTLGTLPWAVYYTLLNVIQLNFPFMNNLQIIARSCLYSFIAVKIIVYYFCNRLYRQVLKQYLKRIFFFL